MLAGRVPKSHPRLLPWLLPSLSMSVFSSKPGRRPRKKLYHRELLLDKAMDLRKKPLLLLHLRSLILSSPSRSLLIRDLEKHSGFIHKWSLLSLVERHPAVFRVSGGPVSRAPISVRLTDRAERVSTEESRARELMEPILVRNLRKLLMLSVDCRIPMEKIKLIESEFGLPDNFENCLIPKYPDYFSIKNECLCLESWDPALAFTAREERLNLGAVSIEKKVKKVPKDGNFEGPFAFKLKFPAAFRPNKSYLEEVVRWQKLAFPSPYLSAWRVQPGTLQARKRVVAVLHEILSLTMEKMLTSDKLDAFHTECFLPSRLLLCLVKHHGIFYITNKGARSTVFLKEAYDGSDLVEKCPLLRFNDKFAALIGRMPPGLGNPMLT